MGGVRKHGDEARRQVASLVDAGFGTKAIAHRVGLHRDTVDKWIGLYRRYGLVGLDPVSEHQKYTFETKLAAVRAFEAGQTKASVMTEFNIRNKTQLDRWVSQHREGGDEALRPRRRGRAPDPAGEEPVERKIRRLEMENAALKKLQALVAEERRRR